MKDTLKLIGELIMLILEVAVLVVQVIVAVKLIKSLFEKKDETKVSE